MARATACRPVPSSGGRGNYTAHMSDPRLVRVAFFFLFFFPSFKQVQFRSAQVVNSWTLETHWTVDASTLPYTCDAILVYELTEDQETLLQSYPVHCRSSLDNSAESSEEAQSGQLQLSVKLNDKMKSDRLYRLCLVLFERASGEEASLLPGCSHSMNWLTLSQSDSLRNDHSDEDVSWVRFFHPFETQHLPSARRLHDYCGDSGIA